MTAPLVSAGHELEKSDFVRTGEEKFGALLDGINAGDFRSAARGISLVEKGGGDAATFLSALEARGIPDGVTVGITGTGGAGKSTLVSRLITRLRQEGRRVGVLAIDPSSPLSGGAVLGDRIRMMGHASDDGVMIRSMASRGRLGGLSAAAFGAARVMHAFGLNPVIVETVGAGQSEFDVVRLADLTVLVLAPGLGDDIQAMKSGLIEVAEILTVNKGDLPGAEALMRDMEETAHHTGRPLLKVSAKTGEGIDALVQTVRAKFTSMKTLGQLAHRRSLICEAEALSIALDELRSRLVRTLDQQDAELKREMPVVRAKYALSAVLDVHQK